MASVTSPKASASVSAEHDRGDAEHLEGSRRLQQVDVPVAHRRESDDHEVEGVEQTDAQVTVEHQRACRYQEHEHRPDDREAAVQDAHRSLYKYPQRPRQACSHGEESLVLCGGERVEATGRLGTRFILLGRTAIHDADHPRGVDGEDRGFTLRGFGLRERQPEVGMPAVNLLHGDLPVPRPQLEADTSTERRLDEGGSGELRRRQHSHVSQHAADGAGERGVEEAHDDPGPGGQFLQLEGDVQVGKVRIAEQAAHGGLPHARFLECVLVLGVADDQRHPSGLCRSGERSLRPPTDSSHRDPELAQFLKHANP